MRVTAIRGKPTRERGNVIARVFKGAPKPKDGNRPGADLDHFRIEWEDSPSVNKEWARECFDEVFGQKPNTLRNVQFLTDDPESALDSVNEKWATGNKGVPFCTRRCTGENIFYEFSGQSANREIKPCEYPACGCAFTYRLRFWLPDFTRLSGVLGEFLLTGHSREDYERLLPSIDNMANADLLRRVAFTLYRKPVRVVQPSGIPVMKSIVHLDIMEAGAQQMALTAGDGLMALPASINTVQETHSQDPVALEFQKFISIRSDDSSLVIYRFIDQNNAVYGTHDTDMVKMAIPNVADLAVGKKHPLDFSIYGTVIGETVIDLRSDPIPF